MEDVSSVGAVVGNRGADGVRKGEIPLFAAAVEILGRHALVADEPAALVVAEPYAGLVVDEHEVPCQIGKARMGCPLGDPHLLATLLRGDGLDEALAEAKDHGVTIHEPDDALKKELGRFIASDVKAMALGVAERLNVEDPEALIERFEQTHTKWQRLLADVDRRDVDALKKIFHDQIYGKIDVSTYGLN
jgi:hypothetical protein